MGNFSRTDDKDGTELVVIVVVESAVGVMDEDEGTVVDSVFGLGREESEGEAKRRVESWDWVITDC